MLNLKQKTEVGALFSLANEFFIGFEPETIKVSTGLSPKAAN